MVGNLRKERMSAQQNQSRVLKVLTALLVSMTAGAILLMALGNNPPKAGMFTLSRYYSLKPIKELIETEALQDPTRWNRIEVYYSGTKAGNIEQLASLDGAASWQDINCHFVVCNGLGGIDGEIQPTEKWVKQLSIMPGKNWYGDSQTIRICVVADSQNTPTQVQAKRLDAMVQAIYRKFNISLEAISYASLPQ